MKVKELFLLLALVAILALGYISQGTHSLQDAEASAA